MVLVELTAAVSAAAAAIQTIVIIVAATYALRQAREAQRSRGLSAALDIFRRLHNSEASQLRRRLYTEVGPKYPNIDEDETVVIERVISDMYYIGYLVEERFVDFDAVADLYYGTAIRVWRATWPFIEDQRRQRGTPYAHYFEKFYRRCAVYAQEHHPGQLPS